MIVQKLSVVRLNPRRRHALAGMSCRSMPKLVLTAISMAAHISSGATNSNFFIAAGKLERLRTVTLRVSSAHRKLSRKTN